MSLVLLVDDAEMDPAAMRLLLEREGYATVEAADSLDAIHVLDGSRPDLIVLDVKMPDFDGLSLLEMIRDNAKWRSIPVVVMTGEADKALCERARQLGAKAYLVKSKFSVPEMLACVRHYSQYRPN